MIHTADASPFSYVGGELGLFEKATNWKQYWIAQIAPYVGGDVLEVGAGIGANTRFLTRLPFRTWTCLEPDSALANAIETSDTHLRTRVGTLRDCASSDAYDSILYIDVLEHIQNDAEEVERAARHLKPGGYLIVLSPAHQFLYSAFDAAIGHHRRYSLSSLRLVAAQATALHEVRLKYLDSAGMLASLANRMLLSQSTPTEKQILTWDRVLVPVSRVLDSLFLGHVGKSVLGVWRKEA